MFSELREWELNREASVQGNPATTPFTDLTTTLLPLITSFAMSCDKSSDLLNNTFNFGCVFRKKSCLASLHSQAKTCSKSRLAEAASARAAENSSLQ